MSTKLKTGTREWSEHSKNIFLGCAHDCRYCYARADALRFKRITFPAQWRPMILNTRAVTEKPRKLDGRIMFPTTHDILPAALPVVVSYLKKWLEAGNEFLIVTKPHYEVISTLCRELRPYKDAITFRFTIGSTDDDTLKFWEPGAPSFFMRMGSLKYAHLEGYRTSVSCEPFLDLTLISLVQQLYPYVTDTIWIGKMNNINNRVDTSGWTSNDFTYLQEIRLCQSAPEIRRLFKRLQGDKIRWKDSIRRIPNLPEVST